MAKSGNTQGETFLIGTPGIDTLDATLSATDTELLGLDGNDTYIIDSQNDVVRENAGAAGGTDTVRSKAASYQLTLNVENLILEQGSGAITGLGNDLNNQLTGNSLDNTLDGRAGADTMSGGTGSDTYYVNKVGDLVVEAVDLTPGNDDKVYSAVTYVLPVNVESLYLDSNGAAPGVGDTSINGTGNALANTIFGNDGKNTLLGLDANDHLVGGYGADTVEGGNGDDIVRGDNVDNTVPGPFGDDTLLGGVGNDELYGGPGSDTMTGGTGDDLYDVTSLGDKVIESPGGGLDAVAASWFGGPVYTSYTLPNDVEVLYLNIGTNPANWLTTGIGNALDNYIKGNGLDNVLLGLGGHDGLWGGAGADRMEGGLGNDTYGVDNADDQVIEASSAGTDTVVSSITYFLGANLENLTLVEGANIDGHGNALDNVIRGNGGANWLFGYAGKDTLSGEDGGYQVMAGGAGDDTYYLDDSGLDRVVEYLGEGTDLIITSHTRWETRLFENVENLTLTGNDDWKIIGNNLNNALTGNAGTNSLTGLAGEDTLRGGTGDDFYNVNSAGDLVIEDPNAGSDTVISNLGSYTLPANVERFIVNGAIFGPGDGIGNALANFMQGNRFNNNLSGLGGDDQLQGNAGDDTLQGGNGNDLLDGETGQDTMLGGAGNDAYYVDNVLDTVSETGGSGIDHVFSRVNFALTDPGIENLTLIAGSAATNATGNALNNAITGNEQNNLIDGGAGADTLDGGAGADTLIGGAGNDTFIADDAGDTVTELAGGGTDLVKSSATHVLAAEVENLTLTGAANVDGTGNALVNTIIGNDGDNRLDGGAGADRLRGGKGNDTYVLDVAADVVTELASQGDLDLVEVNFTPVGSTYTLAAEIEQADLGDGVGNVNVNGNVKSNGLYGSFGANTLNGGDGNDFLMGDEGSDTLNGGNGDDLLLGDSMDTDGTPDVLVGGLGNDWYLNDVNDTVTELAGQGIDTIYPAFSPGGFDMAVKAINVENVYLDYLSGPQQLYGNDLDNIVYGNMADFGDTIQTRGGNDQILLVDRIEVTPVDPILTFLGETMPWEATGVVLGANDQIDGGAGIDRLDGAIFDLNLVWNTVANIVSVEDVNLYSSKTGGGGPNSVDAREISGATQITVHGPVDPTAQGYLAADLTLTQLAAGLPLGIAGFGANVDAQLENSAGGADALSFAVDGFTGGLTTFGVETLSFTLALTGPMANDFDLTNTSGVVTYKFGGTGAAEVSGLPLGATLEFAGYSGAFVLDNAAGATPTVRVSSSDVEFDSTDTLSSLLITTGTHTNGASGGAVDLRGVQFDPGVTIQVDADLGFLDVYTSTDADATASSVPVNLFGSGATGLTLIGSSRSGEFVVGGSGSDRLDGGGGFVDRYIGNEGSDTFVFRFAPNNAGPANGAYLQDFEHGVDKLELDQTGGAFASVIDDGLGGLDPSDFLEMNSVDLANPGGQHVIYERSTGNLYYDADGAGGNAPEIFALTTGDRPGATTPLDADDFVIV